MITITKTNDGRYQVIDHDKRPVVLSLKEWARVNRSMKRLDQMCNTATLYLKDKEVKP